MRLFVWERKKKLNDKNTALLKEKSTARSAFVQGNSNKVTWWNIHYTFVRVLNKLYKKILYTYFKSDIDRGMVFEFNTILSCFHECVLVDLF